LKPDQPNFKQLSAEWAKINNQEVWKAIMVSAENTDLVVSGREVTDHHRSFFRGKRGQSLKKLVEDAAREVALNPGLLGTIMMAETRRPLSYFSSEKVRSYHIGADDFYEGRAAIEARVPAYARVKWDKRQTPEVHYNDAKKPRLIKTILFDSGRDAVLATAVYVKFREVRLREIAAELGGDFDSLPLPTRLALTRMGMAAGTAGAKPYLENALKGVDIFVRRAILVRAYQTQRNATVRTAQAMHLSDWVFGIKVEPASPPKVKELEGWDEELENRYGLDAELEEAEGWGEAQEGFHDLDTELEEAEDWDEAQEGFYDLGPELEEESGEDSEDVEFEDEWTEAEMDDDEQPVILQHDVPAKSIREVVVGQRIELDLTPTPFAANLDKVRWTIPGRFVRDYEGTADSAKLVELTKTELEQPKISFFWVDAADGRTVRAKIRTKSGASEEFVVVFNVKWPKMKAFAGKPGKNHKYKNHGVWTLQFGMPGEPPGVQWEWEITMPPNHAGFIKDIQTVLNDRSRILLLQPDGKETRKLVWGHPSRTDRHVQLDGEGDQKPVKEPVYSEGLHEEKLEAGTSFTGRVSDSPKTDLPPLATTISINDQFVYYIMFKPATDKPQDAIWVPVARAKWFWKVTANQRNKGWTLRETKMKPTIEKVTREFPLYETFAGENQFRQISP
jgi:hypothetical protein